MRSLSQWPVLSSYSGEYLSRVAMPIGGIGTGTVSLGGRGDLRDWEVCNRPAKGFNPRYSFFCLWAKAAGKAPVLRALEGRLGEHTYSGTWGSTEPNHSLPRFRDCRFKAAYPLAQVHLADEGVPLAVRLEAFNPLIPCEADDSGIPVAVLRYVLTNPGALPVEATVCGSLQNFIGDDGVNKLAKGNVNTYREGAGVSGIEASSKGVAATAETFGTMALTTTAPAEQISYRTSWIDSTWSADLSDFWEDLLADGRLENRPAIAEQAKPHASLAVSVTVPPGESRIVTFFLTWHFLNRCSWNPPGGWGKKQDGAPTERDNRIGNHYATRFADAWAVAEYAAKHLETLERTTVQFVKTITRSGLPKAVQEAALNNLVALRSQTAFRDETGLLAGWEGCNTSAGCCPGSCTHVWNYEFVTPYLFGELAWGMRRAEFGFATDDTGNMRFRIQLPLQQQNAPGLAAADGQMGSIIRFHRQWMLSGDDEALRELWPAVRTALEYAWREGGWDADVDGVIEGAQHNTMDVDYHGPNPQITGIYLAALRAVGEMAAGVDDMEFAAKCRQLAARGGKWVDEHLFNGEYYFQEIRLPDRPDERREGKGLPPDAWQIGGGCEADQVLGEFWAAMDGLSGTLNEEHVRSALKALLRYDFRLDFCDHFNPVRSFALNDEAGLVLCSFPRGGKPSYPTPYYAEVWTGIEYTVAAHLTLVGMKDEALKLVSAVRQRHDGKKRNPFDEPECGHHYARAMSAWSMVLAWSGFRYNAQERVMFFAATARLVSWFWSTGHAWGRIDITPDRGGYRAVLRCFGGEIQLQVVCIGDGAGEWTGPRTVRKGDQGAVRV